MPQTSIQTRSTANQSWSDYLVSTYSSSISPTHDPDRYAPSATPITSPTSPKSMSMDASSPSSKISPWGPYTKSGRGGAGNFTWQASSSSSSSQSPPSSATSANNPDLESGIPTHHQRILQPWQLEALPIC
ncbi:hypothetical protein EPUS_08080 [Endocarpon pusillum Z07020]|uniref:Uncharacterized protein n=1 Tax=Endocarpon pusillum (strain Z07020 / HMAS-L-300199) TaxID=1263415 RepID=U1HFM9_ENDPU|nr:uncharacterized protein EPUS_08080 [Endocarpon pusillum Z07020]ERF68920.1 hypothetical protein EPUS_08080 [Endocarpon pusillum Z07020]